MVDIHPMGWPQLRGTGSRRPEHTNRSVGVQPQFRPNPLHGYRPLEQGVETLVDRSHAALGQKPGDPVVADPLPDHAALFLSHFVASQY